MPSWLKRTLLACAAALSLAFPAHAQTASPADTLISDYYRTILGREPDAGGLAFWRGQAQLIQTLGGDVTETWRALAIQFFASAEYRASNPTDVEYIGDLYDAFFKRAPDPSGLGYWQGQLQAGIPREGVLLWFLFSSEFDQYMQGLFGATQSRAEAQMVIDFYRAFLDRLPDENGFKFWVGRFRTAQCIGRQAVLDEVESISSQFLASAEYTSRSRAPTSQVTDFYNAFLRRGPDIQGMYYWLGRIDGSNLDQVRRAFMASPEFQGRVDQVLVAGCPSLAAASPLSVKVADQSVSPFVAVVELSGLNVDRITSASFTVQPKAGSASKPVHATYLARYLTAAGYGSQPGYRYRLPVFGLYAGRANDVRVDAQFADGSSATVTVPIATTPFADPTGVYNHAALLKPRAPGSALGFDFFYMKNEITTPVVMDTDGEVRWWVPRVGSASVSSLFDRGGFLVGQPGMRFLRIELDGRRTLVPLASDATAIHHNVDPGRTGVLVEVDGVRNGIPDLENVLIEVAADGSLINQWSFGDILTSYMASRGDDPTLFVRPGVDWFHMNAAFYDPRDDTLVVSSRENFVIKIRYTTREILWILGDQTKYWYTFPSLRARAVTLVPAGNYPIGQHGISVLPSGELMVFNNGAPSFQNPPGTSPGGSRDWSEVTTYAINPGSLTGFVTRTFDYGRTMVSSFCSSAYAVGASLLVSYARAGDGTKARLVGVGGDNKVVFDVELANPDGCNTSFNAVPIPFEAMTFQ